MEQKFRLRDYPYVVVRFACRDCPRIGSYRLAVLAEKFGADAAISDVLGAISASCLRNKEKHPGRRCQAYLPDLIDPRPPDLPAAEGRRLRVIEGGSVDAGPSIPFECSASGCTTHEMYASYQTLTWPMSSLSIWTIALGLKAAE